MRCEAFHLLKPFRIETPVVFSSPHSGREYPLDFLANSTLDPLTIRSSEDAFVDELFQAAPRFGAQLLCATAPRAYIDMNRSCDELDPAVVDGAQRSPHNPRVASGLGVIPRVVAGGRAIYSGKLPLSEAELRIERHWRPYHAELRRLTEEAVERFGQSILVDCHSMPHEAIEMHSRPGSARPEIVLGDRFGAAASRAVVDQIEEAFVSSGLRVVRNTPFSGAYITQAYGRPSRGFHAVQVEIDRSLYMVESSVTRSSDFDAFKTVLERVIALIAQIGRTDASLAAE